MSFQRRSTRRQYQWQEAAILSWANVPYYMGVGVTNAPIPKRLAIYGDLFSETEFDASTGATTGTGRILDREVTHTKHVERIVGEVTYRGYSYRDLEVGSTGSNPIWLCRFGAIVLPSDGELGVPAVSLGGQNEADDDLGWLYREQFTVVGADKVGENVFGSSPSTDGLNHFVVTRHYDIRTHRVLGAHDILMFQWECFPGPYHQPDNSQGVGQDHCVSFIPFLRMLAT